MMAAVADEPPETQEPSYHLPEKRDWPMNEEIVISGIGGRYPESNSVDEFWEKLLSGIELISGDDRRWPVGYLGLPANAGKVKEVGKLDADFFNICDSDAHVMDPQLRLLHETTYEAIVDAGINPDTLRGTNTACFIGLCYDDAEVALTEDEVKATAYRPLGASRVPFAFDFKGPAFSTDTACASSFSAFSKALAAMRVGHCDRVIVGGVAIHLRPSTAVAFHNLGMLSDDGRSKCMDADANGYCRSEAVVSILLQKKSEAKRIYATVLNARTNNDGYKPEGITFPSMSAQKQLMMETYSEAGVNPLDVKYMEAHMTGTPAGDPVESQAIVEALCQNRTEPLLMGCLKSNMGHTEGASGMCAITKACLAFQRRELPPNLHLKTPNPNIPGLMSGILKPVTERTKFDGDLIGVNSFGFGGCNVHAVLKANEKIVSAESFQLVADIPRLVNVCGRTKEAVDYIFDHITNNRSQVTREMLALLNDSVKIDPSSGMNRRGYIIIDNSKVLHNNVLQINEKKPLWFVFSALGCQWPSMGKALMGISVCAKSIETSAQIVKPLGLDLMDLILSEDKSALKSLVETFIAIVSIQIALVDLLYHLDIQPDGIVGHSVGEIACGYADGCMTSEQTLLTAYYIAKIACDLQTRKGAMGAIGLSREEAEKRCPQGVYVGCNNANDSVTVSGYEAEVRGFLDQLSFEGIFAREVDSCSIPFHSKCVQNTYQPITDALAKVLVKPKLRSSRWLSTSVPMERWHEDEFRYLGPTYYPNSMVSQVQFKEVFQYIPKNAAIVEVGPHAMLLSLLKRGLGPDVDCIPMMKRDNNEQNLGMVLSSIGQIYANGHNPAIERLYPKVEYPVSRETPSISPLIQWDHSKDWKVTKFPEYFHFFKSNQGYSIDLLDVKYQYLSGHCIDGRILFPATGYLWIVWDRFKGLKGYMNYTETSVEFRDVKLYRATILSKVGSVTFKLIIIPETGHFTVIEGGVICVTGFIQIPEKESTAELESQVQPDSDPEVLTMDSKDIYKELRIRGYDYGPTFQGLSSASSDGSRGSIKWLGNWVSFTDSMLQLAILGKKQRGLYLPTSIEYLKCDIKTLLEEVKRKTDHLGEATMDVVYESKINTGASKGIVIKGLKASSAPRRQNAQSASIESYSFLPYNETTFICPKDMQKLQEYSELCQQRVTYIVAPKINKLPDNDSIKAYLESEDSKYILLRLLHQISHEKENGVLLKDKLSDKLTKNSRCLSQDLTLSLPFSNERLIRPQIDIVVENTSSKKLNICEVNSTDFLMYNFIGNLLEAASVGFEYNVLHPSPEAVRSSAPGARVSELKTPIQMVSEPDLIVYKDSSTSFLFDLQDAASSLHSFLSTSYERQKEGSFILLLTRSNLCQVEHQLSDIFRLKSHAFNRLTETYKVAEDLGFVTISEKFDGDSSHSLLIRKPFSSLKEVNPITISIRILDYNWVNDLKRHLIEKKDTTRVWLIADDTPNNGIVGLVNCLRKEPGGERVRCVFQPPGEGKPGHALTPDILRKDLVMNVYRNGAFGSFRHFMVNNAEEVADIEHAYIDIKTKGDLSSFRWFEADHKHWPSLPDSEAKRKQVLCSVYYSALNFKDVMVATGRIPTDAYPSEFIGTGLIGMEFSGRDQSGNRIMGFTGSKGMATTILLKDPHFIFKVPDHWSLEQASTVPVAYLTVYYALFIRGCLRRGESVLIHAGSGGVGQAAISVCLSMGCKVYTTVGTQDKRAFIKKLFPQLNDNQIANSRDTSFEEQILKETDGRGVDIVLNSLSEDKLQAGIRCLADFGRFIEIGKFDIIQNNKLNASDLGRNKTFHVVCVAHLDFDAFVNKSPSALVISQKITKLMEDGLTSGAIVPLKTHVFGIHQTEEAFRFMASGKHTGKVVIKIRDEEPQTKVMPKPVAVTAIRQTFFHPLKSYVITGGLGGFGLELTSWLISKGAKNVVLSSRSGFKDSFQRMAVKKFAAEGGTIIVSNNDVTTFVGAAALLQEAEDMGPVGGIFHLAMVLKDALLENQTVEAYQEACASKVQGTVNLDKLTRKTCPQLDYFVCFSSVVSGRGNAGQTNYGFANSVMERTCEVRRKDGLPGMAIQWGAIGDVGVVAESMGGNDVIIGGTLPQRLPSCLEVMDQFLQSHHTVCSSIVKADNKKTSGGGKGDLVRTVCHILGIKDYTSLDPKTSLGDLGLDSLMAVEVRQGLERDYDTVLSTQEIRSLTIKELQVIGLKKCEPKEGSHEEGRDETQLASEYTFHLPEEPFVRLNDVQHGRPLFFLPPIEGDFTLMKPLATYIARPVIGINWTHSVDNMGSMNEVAKSYVQILRQNYPDTQYDLVGYSFGSVLAFEMSVQFQAMFGASFVKKLLLLDGTPDYLKRFTAGLNEINEKRKKDEDSIEIIFEFASALFPIDNYDQFIETLHQVPSKDQKVQLIMAFVKEKSGLTIEPTVLMTAAERYFRKIKMLNTYQPSGHFEGNPKLLRASQVITTSMAAETTHDYLLSSIVKGKCEVVVIDGDHKGFLSKNAAGVGNQVDEYFQYLTFA